MRKQQKKAQKVLEDILDSAERGVPYDLTFAPTGNLNPEEKEKLQNYLKESYERFMGSWIKSRVRYLLCLCMSCGKPATHEHDRNLYCDKCKLDYASIIEKPWR